MNESGRCLAWMGDWRLPGLVAELAQRVVAAADQLARHRQSWPFATQPIADGLVIISGRVRCVEQRTWPLRTAPSAAQGNLGGPGDQRTASYPRTTPSRPDQQTALPGRSWRSGGNRLVRPR